MPVEPADPIHSDPVISFSRRSAASETAPPARPVDPAVRTAEAIQTVLTALILAFIFRAFFIEAFIIPTGSMAPGLLGMHATMVCPDCATQFDYGPRAPSDDGNGEFVAPTYVICPNCRREFDLPAETILPRAGDRLLVTKWTYALGGWFGPRRWDVIVFRDPDDPKQSFIKRLAALPGETIEIIDGDVYIREPGESEPHIARKTPAAQRQLWLPVYDQTHPPAGRDGSDAGPWDAVPAGVDSPWSGLSERVIRFEPQDPGVQGTLRFAPRSVRAMEDFYAYNEGAAGNYVSDLRLCTVVRAEDGCELEFELLRDGHAFRSVWRNDGRAELLYRAPQADAFVLLGEGYAARAHGTVASHRIEFGHLDHRVSFAIDGRTLIETTDAQYGADLAELRRTHRVAPPDLSIGARGGRLELHRLRVDRDVYYTYSVSGSRRAFAGEPFTLRAGEYFVLGDNSPHSHDSREWRRAGPHLAGSDYRIGTVRDDQIVGQAFFVYLPALQPIDQGGRWRVPDLGKVRFVR